jgi:hypothetical protein
MSKEAMPRSFRVPKELDDWIMSLDLSYGANPSSKMIGLLQIARDLVENNRDQQATQTKLLERISSRLDDMERSINDRDWIIARLQSENESLKSEVLKLSGSSSIKEANGN